jgi:hypothetical protein
MIPNYSRKAMSGLINYQGMVTSYKLRETEKGYRGSKSGISLVKEQRVDGSCCKMNQIAIKVYSNRDKFCFYLTIYLTKLEPKIQVPRHMWVKQEADFTNRKKNQS